MERHIRTYWSHWLYDIDKPLARGILSKLSKQIDFFTCPHQIIKYDISVMILSLVKLQLPVKVTTLVFYSHAIICHDLNMLSLVGVHFKTVLLFFVPREMTINGQYF